MYKAAVIGLGQIGLTYDLDPLRNQPSSHVGAFRSCEHIELVAAMDTRMEQKAVLNNLSPNTVFYTNTAAMIREHQPDVVSICTPPTFRLQLINEILEMGKPKLIFCEKPVAMNVVEAEAIKERLNYESTILVPNLSRRWLSGMERIKHSIDRDEMGKLKKIHLRYTRGIHNTGAHIFDLVNWFAGPILHVQVINQVETSSDREGDLSFSFTFDTANGCSGYAEAFNDKAYYLFELDLFFEGGKIEIKDSADKVSIYKPGNHHLFSGFGYLHHQETTNGLLGESSLKNAVDHIIQVIDGKATPRCTMEDGVFPLYVADALYRSHRLESKQKVLVKHKHGKTSHSRR